MAVHGPEEAARWLPVRRPSASWHVVQACFCRRLWDVPASHPPLSIQQFAAQLSKLLTQAASAASHRADDRGMVSAQSAPRMQEVRAAQTLMNCAHECARSIWQPCWGLDSWRIQGRMPAFTTGRLFLETTDHAPCVQRPSVRSRSHVWPPASPEVGDTAAELLLTLARCSSEARCMLYTVPVPP